MRSRGGGGGERSRAWSGQRSGGSTQYRENRGGSQYKSRGYQGGGNGQRYRREAQVSPRTYSRDRSSTYRERRVNDGNRNRYYGDRSTTRERSRSYTDRSSSRQRSSYRQGGGTSGTDGYRRYSRYRYENQPRYYGRSGSSSGETRYRGDGYRSGYRTYDRGGYYGGYRTYSRSYYTRGFYRPSYYYCPDFYVGFSIGLSPIYGYSYWDPYCSIGFSTLGSYYSHCGGYGHPHAIVIIDTSVRRPVATCVYDDGNWVVDDCGDGHGSKYDDGYDDEYEDEYDDD